MIEIKLTFATNDDALEALQKLAGITTAGVSIDDAPTKPKKETPKAKAEKATKDAFEDAPKATGKGKKKAVPTVEELKAHILAHAGNGADQPEKVKEYVRSFGVAKISDLTEAQRQEAFDGAEAHFAAEEGEEDPMA
jgi:hypothetical protein